MKEIKISGMHCDSCKSLIKMEIEDAGFAEKIISIEQTSKNEGKLILKEVSAEEETKIKATINSLNNYKVID